MSRLRWASQFLFLLIANLGVFTILETGLPCPFFYCHACPAAAFACPIGALQNYAAVPQFPFYIVGVLGLFGLALGRFWCGWACPFGLLQDLIHRARGRNSRDLRPLPRAPWSKFLVLAIVLIAAWAAAETLFCKVCPAGSLFAAIPQRFVSAEFSFGTFFYVHLATLAAAVVLFVLFGRFWCRYLCPMGALLGAFNPVSLMKVKMDPGKCTDCGSCFSVCPVNIDRVSDIERSTDCIRCGKCIEACRSRALGITASLRG